MPFDGREVTLYVLILNRATTPLFFRVPDNDRTGGNETGGWELPVTIGRAEGWPRGAER